MGTIQILVKYFIADLPLIATSFFCMFLVLNIYLKKTTRKRRWTTLIIIEFFEHIITPFLLLVVLLAFPNYWAAILFNGIILLFLFGFIGKIITKSKTKEDWLNILKITGFTFFFLYFYPFLLIQVQWYTSITGWWVLGTTILLFSLFYWWKKRQI